MLRYAHHHTGMIAEPPISHKGKILGGKGAQRVINGMAKREEDMSARAHDLHQGEQRLAAAETAISEREKSLTRCEQANKEREDAFAEFEEHMLRKLEAGYHGIVATVQRIRRDMAQAQRILTHRREQVLYHENFSDSLRGVYGQGWSSYMVSLLSLLLMMFCRKIRRQHCNRWSAGSYGRVRTESLRGRGHASFSD
jgi:hypothetical protein